MPFPRPLAGLVLPALVLVSNAACRGASPPDTDWAHYYLYLVYVYPISEIL